MLICPHSGIGNQIGNYVFAQYLIWRGNEDVRFLITNDTGLDRDFVLDKFNTEIKRAEVCYIKNFLNKKPDTGTFLLLAYILGKNLLFRRRHYFNSLYKILARIRKEYSIFPSKNLLLLEKIVSYRDVLKYDLKNVAVSDCYSPIEEFRDENFREKMRKHFTLKEEPDKKNLEVLKKIESYENPIGVHIRRGDYLKLHIPVVKKEFILEKMKILNESLSGAHFFIFSDDIKWAKENIKGCLNVDFVDINDEKTGYLDFNLMGRCRHRIYSASSFSKWLKYLNPYDNSIEFMPQKKDLITE